MVCVEGNPPAFSVLQTLLCFAFRLLFFLLALNDDPSNVAKPCLIFGFFTQFALSRLLPTWPSHRGRVPAFGVGHFCSSTVDSGSYSCLWKSLRLLLREISRWHKDLEHRIRPWGFPKWLLAQAFPGSLAVAASQDEAAASLQCAPNAGLCRLQCCSLLLYCQFHHLL